MGSSPVPRTNKNRHASACFFVPNIYKGLEQARSGGLTLVHATPLGPPPSNSLNGCLVPRRDSERSMSERSKSRSSHQQNTMLKSIVFYFALQNRLAKPNGCCFFLYSRIALEGAILRLRSAQKKQASKCLFFLRQTYIMIMEVIELIMAQE